MIYGMMELYKHQQRFADKNPDKAMLVWETGTGKTVSACEWIKARPKIKMLVVCPKGIVGKWKRDIMDMNTIADVCTRDEVKKIDLNKYGGLILDEAQDFASPLFTKQRSKRAEVIYNYIKSHPNAPILLLTATPVRSTPWNIHTLACFIGNFWNVMDFRDDFFYMTNMFGRMHYETVKGWQKKVRPLVEQIADIVLMSDCVDVPQQHHKVIEIPWTQRQENELKLREYEEPVAEWHARHRMEQGEKKIKAIQKIVNGYRKVILVCYYKSQIEEYAEKFGKDRLVYVLNGSVKDQDEVIENAKASDDCIFIIQAQMGAGFDAGEFSVVVFASLSFRYVDYVQMKGRVKRINNLHENTFIHLIGGQNDMSVYNSIQANKDFDVHQHITGFTKKITKKRGEDNASRSQVVPEKLPF